MSFYKLFPYILIPMLLTAVIYNWITPKPEVDTKVVESPSSGKKVPYQCQHCGKKLVRIVD